jgi:hypothetical protein
VDLFGNRLFSTSSDATQSWHTKGWLTKKRLKYHVFGIRDYNANTCIIQPHFDFWPHDANMHSFLFTYLCNLKEQSKEK